MLKNRQPAGHSFLPPIPLSNRQLDQARETLHALVKKRVGTYSQIAEQLAVDVDTLKTFCLNRSKRPRGDFITNLSANLRRIQPFTEHDREVNLAFKRLVLELASIEYNRSWYEGLYENFKVSRENIFVRCQQLVGTYAFYRNLGNGMVALKSKLEIAPFDEHTGRQVFKITRRLFGQKERVSDGFLFPLHSVTVMIAKIGEAEGMITIYAEKQPGDDNITGVMLSYKQGDPAFATRIVMMKLTSKNKLLDENYGIVDRKQLEFDIGDYMGSINNAIDQWSVMQIVKLY